VTVFAVPIEFLVPDAAARWRPLVHDAMEFIFTHLSQARLAPKIAEQMALPPDTPPAARLLRLISRMPSLQKLGQVLARNRRLDPALRAALSELENGMSDVTAAEVRAIIQRQLGDRLAAWSVRLDRKILSEATVSAVIRFTWRNQNRERERAVFKVLKPFVPGCFSEEMVLLEQLGQYLAAPERDYGFAVRDVAELFTEVRLLLEHELDFRREQATLGEALRIYRSSLGIRVPRIIPQLCTSEITAMSEETGVKVTDAFPRSPIRRSRIAVQLIEALIAVPLFSRQKLAIFHADPHAGNLFYDEANRELIVLDWALADRLDLELRRHLVMLALMTITYNSEGVVDAIAALAESRSRRLIRRHVEQFFQTMPAGHAPGALDSMRLLDQIALEGVRFPSALFLFRKVLFTLDGVLNDIADVRIDTVMAAAFLTRWLASFGLFHAPLDTRELGSVLWSGVTYFARASHGAEPSRSRKSRRTAY
jgi:ubiquinone biosynthesis protein